MSVIAVQKYVVDRNPMKRAVWNELFEKDAGCFKMTNDTPGNKRRPVRRSVKVLGVFGQT